MPQVNSIAVYMLCMLNIRAHFHHFLGYVDRRASLSKSSRSTAYTSTSVQARCLYFYISTGSLSILLHQYRFIVYTSTSVQARCLYFYTSTGSLFILLHQYRRVVYTSTSVQVHCLYSYFRVAQTIAQPIFSTARGWTGLVIA